jgi:seryl-tRNA synthetase
MLDINYIRMYPDLVRKNLERRNDPSVISLFDLILKKDKAWRVEKKNNDLLRERRNKLSLEINKKKKEGKKDLALFREAKELPKKLDVQEKKLELLSSEIRNCLLKLPNLLEVSVPFGLGDEGNVVVKCFGKKPVFSFKPLDHSDLMKKWGLVDLERAAKISGSRFYFLLGKLARLELALLSYASDFMSKRGYLLSIPPFMINRKSVECSTSLDDFEDVIYKIDGEDLYCISTSEHPLVSQFQGEVFDSAELPKKIAGVSYCFRKEAGTHGKDDKGIFRVHTFSKVEQVVLCRPEESRHFHEELLGNLFDFFKSLGLHFQIVNICTGDLGIVASKKYDLEVWLPGQGKFRELASCSNCLSYQAVRGGIKFLEKNKRDFVHTLNSTCVAVGRMLVAILENFQDKKGVISVPEVLHSYCGFKKIGGEK